MVHLITQYREGKTTDRHLGNVFQIFKKLEEGGRKIIGYINNAFVIQCSTKESIDDIENMVKREQKKECEDGGSILSLQVDPDEIAQSKAKIEERSLMKKERANDDIKSEKRRNVDKFSKGKSLH